MSNGSHYIHDLYNYYKQTTIENSIDLKTFRAITADFGILVSDQLLSGSKRFKMPHKLGSLAIVKYKPIYYDSRCLSIDFQATKKYGKTIYHLNEHTNGYKVGMHWYKTNKFDNYKDFMFVMTRANKRKLAQLFKNKITDYPER